MTEDRQFMMIPCTCMGLHHSIGVCYWSWDGHDEPEMYFETLHQPHTRFWRRVWDAIKHIFLQQQIGYDSTLISVDDALRLAEFCKEYAHERVSWESKMRLKSASTGRNEEGIADLEMRFEVLQKDYKTLHGALTRLSKTHANPTIHDALREVNPCWIPADSKQCEHMNTVTIPAAPKTLCRDCNHFIPSAESGQSEILSELQETQDGLIEAGALDANVTPIINDLTVGMDQLSGFDSNGDPGPGVTLEIALAEVKRLTAARRQEKT